MNVIVCGDRHFDDYEFVLKSIWGYSFVMETFCDTKITKLILGDAKGVDTLAKRAASELGLRVDLFMAHWDIDGKTAGPIRNERMIMKGEADVIVAIHDNLEKSKGTANMIKLATRHDIPFIHLSHENCDVNAFDYEKIFNVQGRKNIEKN